MGGRPEKLQPQGIGDLLDAFEFAAQVVARLADRLADAGGDFQNALHQFRFHVFRQPVGQPAHHAFDGIRQRERFGIDQLQFDLDPDGG